MSLRKSSTGTANTEAEIRIESRVESSPAPVDGHDGDGSFALKHDSSMDDKYGFDHEKNGSGGYTSSSTSQPGSRGSFEEDDEFNYGNSHSDEESDVITDNMKSRRRAPSIQSAISSIPGSVVVYPHAKGQGLPYHLDNYNLNNIGKTRAKINDKGSNGGDRKYKLAPQVREYDSPFRHPSSVCAMQMDDEDDDDTDYFPSPVSRKGRRHQYGGSGTRSPRMSDVSLRSAATPPSVKRSSYEYQSLHVKSPLQTEDVKKEYPLVLLHCTLLPPSLPLSTSSRAKMPSPELLKEMLPEVYWNRWKLLEDKIGVSSILRERGVLISHPQEAYDLLEERLLESLDLVKPRLAYGHFIGSTEEDTHSYEENDGNKREHVYSSSDDEHEGAGNCLDCGQKVLGNPDSDEKRWEVRVYAANGLMKGGAWAAAWRDMEKVDIEVGVWLPSDVRRDLDRRIAYEETKKAEAEVRAAEEDKRIREVYGDSQPLTQEQIDGLDDYEMPSSSHVQDNQPSPPPLHKQPAFQPEHLYSEGQGNAVDLQAALINYIRLLGRDKLFTIATITLVLLALLTPSPFSYDTQTQYSGAEFTTSSAPEADLAPSISNIEAATPISASVWSSPVSNSLQGMSAMSAMSTESAISAISASSMTSISELHEGSTRSEASTPACVIPPVASQSEASQPAPIESSVNQKEQTTKSAASGTAPASAIAESQPPPDVERQHQRQNRNQHKRKHEEKHVKKPDNAALEKPKETCPKAHE